MTKPHKYADAIRAWAEGKEIQFAFTPPTFGDPHAQRDPDWSDYSIPGVTPGFNNEHTQWRVKPEPIEWWAEREAHARGEAIEVRVGNGEWRRVPNPSWFSSAARYEYRIAPKVTTARWAKEREALERGDRVQWRSTSPQHKERGWLDVSPAWALPQFQRDLDIALNEPTNEFRIPHKWQSEIDAFEAGKRVQFSNDGGMTWTDLGKGRLVDWNFFPSTFRIPHRWQDEMDAQARGEAVEISVDGGKTWSGPSVCGGWDFVSETALYRVKPKTTFKSRVRVALLADEIGVWSMVAHSDADAVDIAGRRGFVKWAGDWQEIERPFPVPVWFGVDIGEPGGDRTSITEVINEFIDSCVSGRQPKPNQRFTVDGRIFL